MKYHKRKKSWGKFRSGLEVEFNDKLKKEKLDAEYEAIEIPYNRPSVYKPDFKINDRLYVETKGFFPPSQRKNLLAFKQQHPEIEVCLYFTDGNNKIGKKTTYGQWCERHGIRWADLRRPFPRSWWEKAVVSSANNPKRSRRPARARSGFDASST